MPDPQSQVVDLILEVVDLISEVGDLISEVADLRSGGIRLNLTPGFKVGLGFELELNFF